VEGFLHSFNPYRWGNKEMKNLFIKRNERNIITETSFGVMTPMLETCMSIMNDNPKFGSDILMEANQELRYIVIELIESAKTLIESIYKNIMALIDTFILREAKFLKLYKDKLLADSKRFKHIHLTTYTYADLKGFPKIKQIDYIKVSEFKALLDKDTTTLENLIQDNMASNVSDMFDSRVKYDEYANEFKNSIDEFYRGQQYTRVFSGTILSEIISYMEKIKGYKKEVKDERSNAMKELNTLKKEFNEAMESMTAMYSSEEFYKLSPEDRRDKRDTINDYEYKRIIGQGYYSKMANVLRISYSSKLFMYKEKLENYREFMRKIMAVSQYGVEDLKDQVKRQAISNMKYIPPTK
jgi:hypothetical protein